MKLERTPGPHPALMFIAPSLDVVLVLVFFLVLSTSFLLQPGISVDVPDSPFLLAPQRDPLVVSVLAPPVSAAYFENERVDAAQLRKKLADRPSRNNTIIIKADREAPFERVSEILNISLGLGYPTVIATSEDQ
ncbi:MAG: biopolymer transporter ExbD [Verrucomicrobia bacterium]|nr:biopolymer transporter ExbD [Verrucomicrobiota bacterium]